MTADSFLDTNIIVYAVGEAPNEKQKRAIASGLLESSDFGISAQVLQEFYTTVTSKIAVPLSTDMAFALIDSLLKFPFVAVDQGIVTQGIRNSIKYRISYWDGAIIAAAERLHCKILYTEDLNHGQVYGSVEVRNPFI